MSRAAYDIVQVREDVIVIRDLHCEARPTMSITNDAEAVVSELARRFPGRRIMYYDTEGRLDELCHDGGVFTGFAPGPERQHDARWPLP